MKKQNTKQALFEMMQKVNPDFQLLKEEVDSTENLSSEKPIIPFLKKIFNNNIDFNKNIATFNGKPYYVSIMSSNEALVDGEQPMVRGKSDIVALKYYIKDNFGPEHIENEEPSSFWIVTETNFPHLY